MNTIWTYTWMLESKRWWCLFICAWACEFCAQEEKSDVGDDLTTWWAAYTRTKSRHRSNGLGTMMSMYNSGKWWYISVITHSWVPQQLHPYPPINYCVYRCSFTNKNTSTYLLLYNQVTCLRIALSNWVSINPPSSLQIALGRTNIGWCL